jgi:dihydroneopterin aldolase
MNDEIFIEDLEIFASHGVADGEKLTRQRFLISMGARFDGSAAVESDDIGSTLDYAALMDTVIRAVESSSFNLVERLARHVADAIFLRFGSIVSLDISVKKFPGCLRGKSFAAVGFRSTFFPDEK